MRAAANNPDFERELPNFVAEIKAIFGAHDIHDYFENLRRVGIFGHVGSDDEIEELQSAAAIHEDEMSGASEAFLVRRMKKLLLT